MMGDKRQILTKLEEELSRWQELLASLNDERIASSHLPNGWSIKDVMAHLMAWQQITIARLDAAQRNEEPVLPAWLAEEDPESDEAVDKFNARIYEIYRGEPWLRVHQDWREVLAMS